jgi:hypothetical protein
MTDATNSRPAAVDLRQAGRSLDGRVLHARVVVVTMKRSNNAPIFWLLFGGGGLVCYGAALVVTLVVGWGLVAVRL